MKAIFGNSSNSSGGGVPVFVWLCMECFLVFVALHASVASAQASTSPDWVHPQLGFDSQPNYLQAKEIILTFDDGPGWNNNTLAVLDVLKARNVKATFFVNTGQDVSVNWDGPTCKTSIERIIAEGHELGTHTRTHPHLPLLNSSQIMSEIYGVEADIKAHIPTAPRITIFRAPFGEPYQWKWVGDPQGDASYPIIADIAAKAAVHVGWNIDSEDWKCPEDGVNGGPCMFANVTGRLNTGWRGAILMHSIYERAAHGLDLLLDFVAANGYTIKTVEDAITTQYGMPSAQVIDLINAATGGTTTAPVATTTTTAATVAATTTTTTTTAMMTTTPVKTMAPAATTTVAAATTPTAATTKPSAVAGTTGPSVTTSILSPTTMAPSTTIHMMTNSTVMTMPPGSTTNANSTTTSEMINGAVGGRGSLQGNATTTPMAGSTTPVSSDSFQCATVAPSLAAVGQPTLFVLSSSDPMNVSSSCVFVITRTQSSWSNAVDGGFSPVVLTASNTQSTPNFNYQPSIEGHYRVLIACSNMSVDHGCGEFYAAKPSRRIVVRFGTAAPPAGEKRESFLANFVRGMAAAGHITSIQIINVNLVESPSSASRRRDAATTGTFSIDFSLLGSNTNETSDSVASKVMQAASTLDFNNQLCSVIGWDYAARSVSIDGGPEITPPARTSDKSSAVKIDTAAPLILALSMLILISFIFLS